MNPWGLLAALAAGHFAVPWALHQRLGLGLVVRARGGRGEVALTFDDGPDPETTPAVLAALEAKGVRATFFMLGEKLLRHPELAREVKARGHEVALHGHHHRHAWLKTPWGPIADLDRALEAYAQVFGGRPRFFRPPHGGWTEPFFFAVRARGLVPVQWNLEAGDWVPNKSPEDVAKKVLTRLIPGDIVVMHDAGPGGKKSPAALKKLLPELKARGFRPKPLGELRLVTGGPAEWRPRLFAPIEAAFARLYRVEPAFYGAHSILRLAPAALPVDAGPFKKGTPGVELHMDSERMRRAAEAGQLAAFRHAKASMRDLARALKERPHLKEAKVIFGTSLFHEILAPLGFQVAPLPPGYAKRVGYWMYLLHRAYGGRPLKHVEVRLVYLSREALFERYG